MNYETAANELTKRIVALGPQILAIDSPWALFKVEGFNCRDLEPSLAQANYALSSAKHILSRQETTP